VKFSERITFNTRKTQATSGSDQDGNLDPRYRLYQISGSSYLGYLTFDEILYSNSFGKSK